MKNLIILLLILSSAFTVDAQKLQVAVAANAQFVAKMLVKEFKKETGIKADLIVGASGKLTTQIEQGAPFDVFMSADTKYPDELYAKKLTLNKPEIYAYGSLVMWSKKNISLAKGLRSLTNPAIQKIAVANPALAPYGEAAMQALKATGLATPLQPKLVFGESIAQVNEYLLSGNADVAFTAKSVVLDMTQKNKGNWKEVDAKLYKPIAQAVVILKSSTGKSLVHAQRFYKFLFSREARSIFTVYGYRF